MLPEVNMLGGTTEELETKGTILEEPGDDFDWKKSLCAFQGKFVITNESSPFEWVGSDSALPCIIILVHGQNDDGKKVAVCGHLSEAESPYSFNVMLYKAEIKDILSIYLVSGDSDESAEFSQTLLSIIIENWNNKIIKFLGHGITQIALNVKSGKITH